MQKHCTELTERLLKSLDKEYNVVDMGAVIEVITALERTAITKDVLEKTRLGKYVNELRRKTDNESLAKRAKDLVRRWRGMVLPSTSTTPQPTPADTAPPALNGESSQSPAARCQNSQSQPGNSVQSPLLRNAQDSSPGLLLHSDQSRSPLVSPNKPATVTSNHRQVAGTTLLEPKSDGSNHSSTEAVPRTHSSNKRLRKEMNESYDTKAPSKRQRMNGESLTGSIIGNSQVPSRSPALRERNSDYVVSQDTGATKKQQQRGRKKGGRQQQVSEDRVKEKFASIARNPKLKTTQELLADLQARGSNSAAYGGAPTSQGVEPPNVEDVLRGNDAEVTKYLGSKHNHLNRKGVVESPVQRLRAAETRASSKYSGSDTHDDDTQDSVIVVESEPKPPRELTYEEIMAKLPPLDRDAIVWSDDEDAAAVYVPKGTEQSSPREVGYSEIDRLHTMCVEGMNGNYQPRLPRYGVQDDSEDKIVNLRLPANCPEDIEFREWHEMLARPSCDGQILHILPYVVID